MINFMNISSAYRDVLMAVQNHKTDNIASDYWKIWKMLRSADDDG